MNLSLLYTDEIKHGGAIDLRVYEDLGLTELFEDLYEGSEFFEIIRHIPATEDIKMRQEIFEDIFNDDTEAFNDFRILLHKLLNYYHLYTEGKKPQFSTVYYFLMLKEFTSVVSGAEKLFSDKIFKSNRLSEIKDYLLSLPDDGAYQELIADIAKLERTVNVNGSFAINVNDRSLTVLNRHYEENLSEELTEIAKDLGIKLPGGKADSNRTLREFFIQTLLAEFADEFQALSDFYQKYESHYPVDMGKMTFEIEFYLNMKRFYKKLQKHDINLCIPQIAKNRKISLTGCQDLVLINQGVEKIIPNDIETDENERIQIITGVNSGGKTSFLRAAGITQLLFYTGGYVPSLRAELYPFRNIFTHFPEEEKNQAGYGRLKDEEERLSLLMPEFDRDCLLLLNETYSSTYEAKAVEYSEKLLDGLSEKQVFCFFVTHLHPLIDYIGNKNIGLLTPLVDEKNGNKRLYKIQRVNQKVYSFTREILQKHGLTKQQLKERLEAKQCD